MSKMGGLNEISIFSLPLDEYQCRLLWRFDRTQIDVGDGQQSDFFKKLIAVDADFRTSDIPTTLFFANSAVICHRNKMKTYLKSAGNSVSSETQECPGTQCGCFTQHDTHMNTRTTITM